MKDSEIQDVAKKDFDEIMKRISPFIPKDTGTEVTTIGKWECGKRHKEDSSVYPHSYSI